MTADKVITMATQDLGYMEDPAGSNKTKYGAWYGPGWNGQPWCMMAVQYWFDRAGMPIPYKTASCGGLMRWAKAQGQWVTENFAPGDVVIYDFSGRKTDTQHCGVVVAVCEGPSIACIEGNTDDGNNCNGGKVLRRLRSAACVVGAWRPPYAAPKTDTPQIVAGFSDCKDHYARADIELAARAGLIRGDGKGHYRPDDPITRAEQAVVMARLLRKLGLEE